MAGTATGDEQFARIVAHVRAAGGLMYSCPAVVFEGRLQVKVRQVRLPDPLPGDIVVRTLVSGISAGTERWTLTGRYGGIDTTYPFIPGYQRVGVIEWVGPDVLSLRTGESVFINETRLDEPTLRDKHWTGHLGYSVAPASAAIPLPAGVSEAEAAISPLAAVAWNGIKLTGVTSGDLVVVLGQGVIGQMSAQLARMRGATVIASDPVPERRRLSALHSADEVVSAEPDILRAVVARRGNRGANVVIDTTGRSDLVPLMVDLVKERGRICLQGYYPDPLIIDPHPTHLKQPQFIFTCYWVDHAIVLGWLARGQLTMRPFITHTFDYRDAPEAYRLLVEDPSGMMTGLLKWGSQPDPRGTART